MEILYCDKCGHNFSDDDLISGTALRTAAGQVFCAKCAPADARPKTPAQGAGLARATPRGLPRKTPITGIRTTPRGLPRATPIAGTRTTPRGSTQPAPVSGARATPRGALRNRGTSKLGLPPASATAPMAAQVEPARPPAHINATRKQPSFTIWWAVAAGVFAFAAVLFVGFRQRETPAAPDGHLEKTPSASPSK